MNFLVCPGALIKMGTEFLLRASKDRPFIKQRLEKIVSKYGAKSMWGSIPQQNFNGGMSVQALLFI
jgi:hypothetical protein